MRSGNRRTAMSVVAVLLVGALLGGCSSDDDSSSGSTTTEAASTTAGGGTEGGGDGAAPTPLLDDPTGELAEADCWWDLAEIDPAVTVTCHTLTVPADWAEPDGDDRVVLPVARLHHEDVAEDVEPLVNLHGGPGGDLLDRAPVGASGGQVVEGRDVILYDQRGSGRSLPDLNCPEKEVAAMAALTTTDPVADELQRNLDAVQTCRDRLVGEGIDLDDYNTHASVNDLDALRHAFGLETWNLSGGSYGTRIGLAYARQHPDRVRALALDSVYPPQVGSLERAQNLSVDALARLVDECTADPACSSSFPDLGATIEEAAASLDAEPGETTLTLEIAGEEVEQTYRIDGGDFRSGMFAALYENGIIPLLPAVIGSVAAGDRSILATYIEMAGPRLTGLSEGAYYSIDCADAGRLLDGASAEDVVGDGRFAMYSFTLAQTFCDVWDVTPLPESFNEPAVPDVPTIVFAGTLDPVTPWTDSEAQAEAMPDARLVIAPRGGHGDIGFSDCTADAYLGFLDDPSSDLPACTADIAAPPFQIAGA